MEIARGQSIGQCVVLYVTDDGAMGYASFGRTKALCAKAKALADSAFIDALLARDRPPE